ncbi:unnamed protein product [Effrenium voratum]|nr:unnamed protein product [Effrenium voratum]
MSLAIFPEFFVTRAMESDVPWSGFALHEEQAVRRHRRQTVRAAVQSRCRPCTKQICMWTENSPSFGSEPGTIWFQHLLGSPTETTNQYLTKHMVACCAIHALIDASQ